MIQYLILGDNMDNLTELNDDLDLEFCKEISQLKHLEDIIPGSDSTDKQLDEIASKAAPGCGD